MSLAGARPLARAGAWVCARRWRQALVLAAVCGAVFLPRLGATGLSMSEGHRVIPAWEMLEDARAGDPHWLVPRMFGTAYLRKPPGVMWAIAGTSAVLGETEFAARLPSAIGATLLALSVWWFATRWFGSPWGLAAGLAQALLPVTWPSARSAEIESLHMLTTGVACLLALDLVVRPKSGAWRAGLLACAVLAMLVTKGPAGAPFVCAGVVGGWLAVRRTRGALWAFCGLGAGVALGAVVLRPFFVAAGAGAVVQGAEDFLWERSRLVQILTLAPAILGGMLPAALALLFPWGPDVHAEREIERAARTPGRPAPVVVGSDVARALAWSCVVALAALTALGVGNPRYGLPLCALVTPLAAYVVRGAGGAFVGKRPRIARAMLLGSPIAWALILVVGAGVYLGILEPDRRESSGRGAGITLAASLPDGAEVWADEMIEARPEVLLYARREAERQGKSVRVRWLKPEFMPAERPAGLLVLLREDELVDEVARYSADGRFGALTPIARGEVHKYRFVLCRAGGLPPG